MASLSSTYIAYKTIQLLTRKWEDWDAYKLGIIDDNGKTIKQPKTAEEKSSFDMFHVMVRNLKLLLNKFPFGKTRIASFAAGLWLIKEQTDGSDDFERIIFEHLGITQKDILLESTKQSNISSGFYDFGDYTFMVKEGTLPVAKYLGQDIYKLQDIVTKEYVYVTKENLKKL